MEDVSEKKRQDERNQELAQLIEKLDGKQNEQHAHYQPRALLPDWRFSAIYIYRLIVSHGGAA